MEPERLFSFTWHPYAIDPEEDYSGETPTLVEFTLEKTPPAPCCAWSNWASTSCRRSAATRPSA